MRRQNGQHNKAAGGESGDERNTAGNTGHDDLLWNAVNVRHPEAGDQRIVRQSPAIDRLARPVLSVFHLWRFRDRMAMVADPMERKSDAFASADGGS